VNGGLGLPDTSGGAFAAAYTHQFGNGVSGTLAVQDNKERKRGIYNGANPLTITGAPAGLETKGGNTWPEIVGQLRIEQAWGGFHLAANAVNNHVAYNCGGTPAAGCTELSGHPSDKAGFGVTGAFRFNVPTGVNDAIYIGGTWSRGNTMVVQSVPTLAAGAFGLYGGSSIAYGSFTGSYVFDSVYSTTTRTGAGRTVAPTGLQLTNAYGGTIAFEHGWNAQWRTSVFGGGEVFDYNSTANAILCSRFAAGSATGTLTNAVGANVSNTSACNFDYRVVGAGTRTYWTPVADLTIGVELQWTNHHVGHGDGVFYNQAAIVGFKPATTYQIRDQNIFAGIFSIRRFF
jgi:hypothetical protein